MQMPTLSALWKNPLVEELELEGFWFLPGQTENAALAGTLFFSADEGITLKLNGVFADPYSGSRQQELILGLTGNGEPVTLLRCSVIRGQISVPGYARDTYRAELAFIGRHFNTPSEITFESLWVRYWNLEECVGRNGLSYGSDASGKSFNLGWAEPSPFRANLGEYALTTEFLLESSGDHSTSRTITQHTFLKLSSTERRPFEDFLNGPCRTLHSLLELAANDRVPVLRMQGLNPEHPPIDVLFQQRRGLPLPKRQALGELSFTFDSMGAEFAECVARWHNARTNYGPTFDHYFSLNRTEMPLEHRFLSLSQALESYHRRANPDGREEPKAQYEARLKRLLASILDSEDKNWLNQKLAFANEVSFRKRFEALYDLMPDQLKAAMGTRESFAGGITKTRNYLTHFNASKKEAALQGLQLATAVHQLSAMLRIVFLLELGVSPEKSFRTLEWMKLLHLATPR